MKPRELNGSTTDQSGPTTVARPDSVLLKDLMNLVHHCCVTRYEDGTARLPGWMTIGTLGSIWKVGIKDPDSALTVTAVGLTLDEALTTGNVLLASDNGPWEVDPFLANRPGRRRKKGLDK